MLSFVDKKAYACRVWKKGTAPPKSLTSFGIVHHTGPVVRGQYDDEEGMLGSVSNGQLLGLGLLAGAIVAIVIAANNDEWQLIDQQKSERLLSVSTQGPFFVRRWHRR